MLGVPAAGVARSCHSDLWHLTRHNPRGVPATSADPPPPPPPPRPGANPGNRRCTRPHIQVELLVQAHDSGEKVGPLSRDWHGARAVPVPLVLPEGLVCGAQERRVVCRVRMEHVYVCVLGVGWDGEKGVGEGPSCWRCAAQKEGAEVRALCRGGKRRTVNRTVQGDAARCTLERPVLSPAAVPPQMHTALRESWSSPGPWKLGHSHCCCLAGSRGGDGGGEGCGSGCGSGGGGGGRRCLLFFFRCQWGCHLPREAAEVPLGRPTASSASTPASSSAASPWPAGCCGANACRSDASVGGTCRSAVPAAKAAWLPLLALLVLLGLLVLAWLMLQYSGQAPLSYSGQRPWIVKACTGCRVHSSARQKVGL